MARRLRVAAGGIVYHVLNRAVGRNRIFRKDGDYTAFEKVLRQAHERTGTRLLAYCVMPNHWHLVLWPREDGELSQYIRWLSVTHTQRWHAHHHSAGTGPLYQGRFKTRKKGRKPINLKAALPSSVGGPPGGGWRKGPTARRYALPILHHHRAGLDACTVAAPRVPQGRPPR
jgi:REP element-mobilizing transposase RayT